MALGRGRKRGGKGRARDDVEASSDRNFCPLYRTIFEGQKWHRSPSPTTAVFLRSRYIPVASGDSRDPCCRASYTHPTASRKVPAGFWRRKSLFVLGPAGAMVARQTSIPLEIWRLYVENASTHRANRLTNGLLGGFESHVGCFLACSFVAFIFSFFDCTTFLPHEWGHGSFFAPPPARKTDTESGIVTSQVHRISVSRIID